MHTLLKTHTLLTSHQCPVKFLPCKYKMLQLGSSMLTMSTALGPIAGQSRTSMETSLLRGV